MPTAGLEEWEEHLADAQNAIIPVEYASLMTLAEENKAQKHVLKAFQALMTFLDPLNKGKAKYNW